MPRTPDQAIIDLYDRYTHGTMGRRAFLNRLGLLAGGSAAASALLPLLENNYAQAAIVAEDDERLVTNRVSFKYGDTQMGGYMARPAESEALLSGVLVIHENRGLNPHIEDVTRRMALEGFVAFAPDVLSPEGGTPADLDAARTMIRAVDRDEALERMLSASVYFGVEMDKINARFVASCIGRSASSGFADDACEALIGAIGFCWGGGMVNRLAVVDPNLKAGVAYYGRQAPVEDVPKIWTSLMLHYAGEDARINAGIADYEAALKAAGKDYQIHMYEGAQHAFNNDTNEARYDKPTADLAWSRTVAFLKEKLD